MGDKNQQEYLRKIQELELELEQIKIQEEQEYKQLLETIKQVELNISKLSDLFVYDFLPFYNLEHQDYVTLRLLYYIYPECQDVSSYVMRLLDKLLKNILKDVNLKERVNAISKVKDLPSIEQIVDEVNIRINQILEKVDKNEVDILKPVNDHLILKILYLYTKDFAYEKSNLGYLVKKILQANNISFELPDVYRL